jgi:hypothetical protein
VRAGSPAPGSLLVASCRAFALPPGRGVARAVDEREDADLFASELVKSGYRVLVSGIATSRRPWGGNRSRASRQPGARIFGGRRRRTCRSDRQCREDQGVPNGRATLGSDLTAREVVRSDPPSALGSRGLDRHGRSNRPVRSATTSRLLSEPETASDPNRRRTAVSPGATAWTPLSFADPRLPEEEQALLDADDSTFQVRELSRGPTPSPAGAGRIHAPESGPFYSRCRSRSRFGRQESSRGAKKPPGRPLET